MGGASGGLSAPDAIADALLYRGFTVGKGGALRFGASLRAASPTALLSDAFSYPRAAFIRTSRRPQIGRASWRVSVCQYVYISVVDVALKHKKPIHVKKHE